jgi:antitoxin HicB
MRRQGLRKADLARKLTWKAPMIDRLFDIRHATRLESIDAAFAALGERLTVDVEENKQQVAQ